MSIEAFDAPPGRVLARIARHLEVGASTVELSLPQYRTLGYLAEGEDASSRLAERLAVSPPSVTAVVDGLVARGLVERQPVPGDRRRHQILLTPAGARLLRAADEAIEERLVAVLDHLPASEAKTARSGMASWQRALDAYRTSRRRDTVAGGVVRP